MNTILQIPRKIGRKLVRLHKKVKPTLQENNSAFIRKGVERNLYKTKFGDFFWLNSFSYLDKEIIHTGIWEPETTNAIKSLLKPDDFALDIGANIGYDTVIMSRIVGENGKVYAFEPTKNYFHILKQNIEENNIKNVELYNYGLSDKSFKNEISIGVSSATMHWVENSEPTKKEIIELKSFDDFVKEKKLERLNFIKLDIDGHEPLFFKGAEKSLELFQPVILMEVNHANYLKAGYTAWDFYKYLKDRTYFIYSENQKREYLDLQTFLKDCGNFANSANIIVSKKRLS